MTSEQAKFALDFILPTLKQEYATTTKVLAAAPNANLDYRPSDRCMAASRLLWHLASANVMFLDGILSGSFAKSPDQPESVTTPQQISEWHAETVAPLIEKLSAYTPEEAAKIVDFFGFIQAPAANIVIFAINHNVHHRGQLSSYLRPMGGKVPSIYGPSADENPFAKAEAQ